MKIFGKYIVEAICYNSFDYERVTDLEDGGVQWHEVSWSRESRMPPNREKQLEAVYQKLIKEVQDG